MDDDARTQETLDALGDVFLTNTLPRGPATGDDDDTNEESGANDVPMRLTPKMPTSSETEDPIETAEQMQTATLRYSDDDDEQTASIATIQGTGGDVDAEPANVQLEAVFLGNLPVLGRPWLSQYAHQRARERGPVAVLHLESDRIDLELITTTDHPWPNGGGNGQTRTLDGRSLTEQLSGLFDMETAPVRTWLVHVPRPQAATNMARALALRQWTLLTGSDNAAVTAAYQQLKRMLESDGCREQRSVSLAVMGSDEQTSLQAATKLNETVGRQLKTRISLACTLKQMVPVHQCVVASHANAASLWPGVLSFFRRTAGPQLISIEESSDQDVAVGDVSPPTASAPVADQPPTAMTPALTAPAKSPPPAAPVAAEPAAATAPAQRPAAPPNPAEPASTEPDLALLLEQALPGSVQLDARCPHQPHAVLLLDQDGTLHLLCHQHRGTEDSLRGALVNLLTTRNWVKEHQTLLQFTQRQCRMNMAAEPVLHLFTDQAKSATALAAQFGGAVRLHLLLRIKVGSEATWHCTDLN